jgi:hypothetical protein
MVSVTSQGETSSGDPRAASLERPRGVDPGGEGEHGHDPESGHLAAESGSYIRGGGGSESAIPNPSGPPPISKTLAKIVGHLWKKAPTRSFMAVVRAEVTPIIRVAMQPRGGGRQGSYG